METETVISWDVGIKNLAYCVLQKKNDDFSILNWGVINLVEDRQKCQFNLRNGTQCQELAKFCIYHTDKIPLFNDLNDGIGYTCAKHKNKMIPTIEQSQENKCCICDDKSEFDLCRTNYHWCMTHYNKKGESFVKKIKTKKVSIINCNKQPLQDLSEKLFHKLDKIFLDFIKIDNVIIENQPSLRNPNMKTLASILYSYFVIRGIIDKEKTKSSIKEVKFVSPSNKLKINEENTTKVFNKCEKNNAKVYKLTKNLGIKYCKAIINDDDNKKIDNIKKKDDMCDAFLQGFQYLFSPMPKKYFDKLSEIGFDDKSKKK